MNGSRIAAVGHYQPAKILTNEDLAGLVDTSDEWITSRVGIRTRHIAGPDEPVDELAGHAAAKALASAGLGPEAIDLVVVATSTAIDRSPNMAARVANRLSIPNPAAMDVNVVCAGFTHALATADHAVRAGCRHAGARHRCRQDVRGHGLDRPHDLRPRRGRGGRGRRRGRRGARHRAGAVGIGARDGERRTHRGHPPRFAQEGQSVYRWATTKLPPIARAACEKAGLTPADLAAVVLHQANLRIIEPLAMKIGAVNAVVARDVVDSGNTSAASIPSPSPSSSNAARSPAATPCCCSASAATCRTRDRWSAAREQGVRGDVHSDVTRHTRRSPGHRGS